MGRKRRCQSNHPAAVIALATISHWNPTPTHRQMPTTLSLPHESLNRRLSPQSVLAAPPQWIVGQVVFTSRAQGKPRQPGHETPQSCRLFEAGKWEFASAWACITHALRPLWRWSGGKVQTHRCTRALSAQTRAHALFSVYVWIYEWKRRLRDIPRRMCSYLFVCCPADIEYCSMCACLSDEYACLYIRSMCKARGYHHHNTVFILMTQLNKIALSGFNVLHKRLVWEHRTVMTSLFCK